MKNIPKRMCVCCRTMFPQKELIRVVKTSNNEVVIDEKGKIAGRGAYVCTNKSCVDKGIKQKVFDRVFSIKVSDSLYNELKGKTKNE